MTSSDSVFDDPQTIYTVCLAVRLLVAFFLVREKKYKLASIGVYVALILLMMLYDHNFSTCSMTKAQVLSNHTQDHTNIKYLHILHYAVIIYLLYAGKFEFAFYVAVLDIIIGVYTQYLLDDSTSSTLVVDTSDGV